MKLRPRCEGPVLSEAMWPRRRLFFLALSCGIILWATSQGVPAATSSFSPDQFKNALLSATEAERTEISKELHLAIPKRTRRGAKDDIPCTVFDSVEMNYMTLLRPGPQAVLDIRSSWCQYSFLTVLGRTHAGVWGFVQTIPFPSSHREPRISFQSVIEPAAKEIVVRGIETDYGTVISQTDMAIFKLYADGLQVIFEEPERVVYTVPTAHQTNTDQVEENQYSFVDPNEREGATSLKQILRSQVIRDRKTTIVRWWLYIWVPEIKRFQAHPTSQ